MKLTQIWNQSLRPTVSFELFPARNEKAADRLDKAIDILADLKPDFISVTFGAGGSTRAGSYQLLEKLIKEKGLEALGYFAGYGLSPGEITEVLDSYQELGIENILVVRGDVPHGQEDFQPHPDSFKYASELMAFIRPRYDFCLGVAAYPEGHIEAQSLDKDLEYLKLKVDNGAEYIVTNYSYDNQFFLNFVGRCRAAGIDVPIMPGVMPIYSVKMMESLASLCGATIVDGIRDGLSKLPDGDKEALRQFGVEFAIKQCRGLLEAGVPGLHIYTMDRSKSVSEIVTILRKGGSI